MQVRIDLRPVALFLASALGVLGLLGVWVHVGELNGRVDPDGLTMFWFNLSQESNVPTWFSSSLMLLCAAGLTAIGVGRRQRGETFARHWLMLAAVFVYLSLDEAIMIHEYASLWLDYDGIFYFGWVIPAGILVFVLGMSYIGFMVHLPRTTRARFFCAGMLYVGGALGIELILGWWLDRGGEKDFVYSMIDAVEETMEIGGLSLFLWSILDYMGGECGRLYFEIGQPAAAQAPAEPPASAFAESDDPTGEPAR